MIDWYSPMTSAPISRESRMRYTNPRNWETMLVPVGMRFYGRRKGHGGRFRGAPSFP